MKNLSVIIPSKTASNLLPCIDAVRTAGNFAGRVFIVDDFPAETPELPQAAMPFEWVIGAPPFIFARNVNRGIVAAGDDDVVLLNDDALLRTPNGFDAMHRAAYANDAFGVISATTNVSGNVAQNPSGTFQPGMMRDEPRTVAFVCVLIPRRTIDIVGLLDEQFTAYGWDDNDYCRRVRAAGLKIGIFDGCYVDHGSLRSTYRGDPRAAGDITAGAAIYRAKWGDLT